MRSDAHPFTLTASITSEAGHGENLNEIDMSITVLKDRIIIRNMFTNEVFIYYKI